MKTLCKSCGDIHFKAVKAKVMDEFFCTSDRCMQNVRFEEVGIYLGIDGGTFHYCPFCGVKFTNEKGGD